MVKETSKHLAGTTGIIPFSDGGSFSAILVSDGVCLLFAWRVGFAKGQLKHYAHL